MEKGRTKKPSSGDTVVECPTVDFVVTVEAEKRGIYVVNDDGYKFEISVGCGLLGYVKVTYFVPENLKEFNELARWFKEKRELRNCLRIIEFRKIEGKPLPVLITEPVKDTVISYISKHFANGSTQAVGMRIITIISDIFTSLTKADEQNCSCPLENVFVGEDGVVRLPFVSRSSSDNSSLNKRLKIIFKHLLETYTRGSEIIPSVDLQLLEKNLFSNPDLLNLFKTKRFPLYSSLGIKTFIMMNTDFVKDKSTVDFGKEMWQLFEELNGAETYWEQNILSNGQQDWIDVVKVHNHRRYVTPETEQPGACFSSSGSKLKRRNCPMQYIQLSRNLNFHQHSKSDPYPVRIQNLSRLDLIDELYGHYPGVFMAFYITMCCKEPQNIKLPA